MNNKINGWSLYPDLHFGQFRFLYVLYRVIQTKLLQKPALAQCAPPPLFGASLMQNSYIFLFD